jgi:phosphate/sulfate permease
VHHWLYQCTLADLCFHCHKGYGDGVCWKHQALSHVLSTWHVADDRIEQAMLPAHRWLDQHVIAKLTILLVMALACCWALWYAQIVIPYHNEHMLIAGIIAIALIYVSASIAALLGWRQLRRMSEQADIIQE